MHREESCRVNLSMAPAWLLMRRFLQKLIQKRVPEIRMRSLPLSKSHLTATQILNQESALSRVRCHSCHSLSREFNRRAGSRSHLTPSDDLARVVFGRLDSQPNSK